MAESVNEETRNDQRTHPVDEVLPAGKMAAYGLQHVLAMYAGIVAVPLIVATALDLPQESLVYIINISFFMCGVATFIQAIGFWKFGVRLPIVQGTTFASVTPMILIGQTYGLQAVFGSIIVAGLLTVLAAPFFSQLRRLFPPVVNGAVITIIGASLLPVAINWAGGGDPEADSFGSLSNVAIAFGVLILILAITRLSSGYLGRIAILIGLVAGLVVTAVLGVASFGGVADSAWVGIPIPFNFGFPEFRLVPIITMTLVMVTVMVETTADILAIGEITERETEPEDVARGLRADGISSAVAGVFGVFPFSAFAQNVGLVRFTGVKSRFVVAAGGGILILLGLLPKLGAIVASIPLPVLGGAGIVLFGTVAAAGIQTLGRVDLAETRNLIIVAVSIAFGLIPAVSPEFYSGFPERARVFLDSGIIAASLAAILLNVVFNLLGRQSQDMGDYGENFADFEESLTVMDANGLDREQFADRFAPLFQGVRWVPEGAYDEDHPFSNIHDLRHAFQISVYGASEEDQVELLRSYTPLGGDEGGLSSLSVQERRWVGLTSMTEEEEEEFRKANAAYEEKFGFPLVVAIRDHTKETLLDDAKSRLKHSRGQEITISIVEVMEIAAYRLQDMITDLRIGSRS
ncbi:2-oxo-4-hydroxy-4-carboxy-5-ureidoimidazoline decarboxylase [Rubrobacter aplysinae]|uniref:2-oxo-4-hydroxy-4-carboxy-5-ureidoimidazoline decarboxylase n=1 Tax=Rubrobacter aplysinae TaxID=909625 RepID=UPI00064C0303|nr:2-oxo-4-hydroxy-4-carboxy-5-ureidoimidazoline decarboxylase [Rubrobacter aplysinae]